MEKDEVKNCYKKLLDKLDLIEESLDKLKKSISNLKTEHDAIEEEEICLDEIEADRAAYDAIQEICLESLLEIEPKGDA